MAAPEIVVPGIREYMMTPEYSLEKSRGHIMQLLNPLTAAVIEDVIRNGANADPFSIELSARALARISFGKDGAIPFGIYIWRNKITDKQNVTVVSDPYYENDAKVANGPVGDLYLQNKSQVVTDMYQTDRPMTNDSDGTYQYPSKRSQVQELMFASLLHTNPKTSKGSPEDSLLPFIAFMQSLKGDSFIYGHDKVGGRFHVKTISTPKFSYKHSPSPQKKSP